jgi:hypothetical protein
MKRRRNAFISGKGLTENDEITQNIAFFPC